MATKNLVMLLFINTCRACSQDRSRLLDLDRFNAQRRELVGVIEAIRCDLRDQKLNRTDPIRLVDSAPVTVVTYTQGSRCSSVVGSEYFGVVTSKKGKVYGFRLHATVTATN
jgi:hypothetical protein